MDAMGMFDGKVAFVTGAARGQGRNHAIRLAREGASVIAIDVADAVLHQTLYPPATEGDLKETAGLLEKLGQPFVVEKVDVRDLNGLGRVVAQGVKDLGGRLDIVIANAAVTQWDRFWEMSEEQWLTVVDVNLSGVWRTLKVAVPHMISAGNGGSIVLISSVAGIKSLPGQAHYSAAKHGIRVNSVHPWGVSTPMGQPPVDFLTEHPNYAVSFGSVLPPYAIAEPDDISDAVLWLASDMARTVTGTQLTVDMGATKV
jgi:NAD(P)-dependent dehydrogenase (short-subunit alcohol dehydrogenase family)